MVRYVRLQIRGKIDNANRIARTVLRPIQAREAGILQYANFVIGYSDAFSPARSSNFVEKLEGWPVLRQP